jgi:hypothetical protein
MYLKVYAHTRRTAMHGIPAELDGFCVSSTAVGLLVGGLSALAAMPCASATQG